MNSRSGSLDRRAKYRERPLGIPFSEMNCCCSQAYFRTLALLRAQFGESRGGGIRLAEPHLNLDQLYAGVDRENV
ncbi:MAG: hypothetical protein M3O25_01735, partial [Actinomycetota bacterium]|nr:hypothetical protein [Actinomycetota bacterium]